MNSTQGGAALDSRKQLILKAIVDDFIMTAEPVGSKALVQRYNLPLSPATVRGEMAELEQEGYLEQPHPSAGRVPSDSGYRAYVDSLMTLEEPDPAAKEEVRRTLRAGFNELPDLLRAASGVLSESTGYTSIALTPRLKQSKLAQIRMLMIEPGRALIVVVLSAGVVKDRVIRVPDLLDEAQLREIAEAVEHALGGVPLEDITLVAVASALQEVLLPESLLNQVLFETYVAIKQAENLETYIDGVPNIFIHPEFQTAGKARALVDALSRDGMIVGILEDQALDSAAAWSAEEGGTARPEEQPKAEALRQMPEEQRSPALHRAGPRRAEFMIRIGQEIALESLRDCSFVTSTYRLTDRIAGNIAVVGPRRMNYSKVISQISFVRQTMDQLMSGRINKRPR